MKPATKTVCPSTLSLDSLRALAALRLANHDGRLQAIIARGDTAVAKEFPSTVKQSLDPKNKTAKADVEKMIMAKIQKRAVKFLKANP